MSNWKLSEDECTKYLNDNFGNETIKFEGVGKSNSTLSDIKVLKNGNLLFYIEAKMDIAQSGQFVLLKENNEFVYSNRNTTPLDTFSEIILNYINENFNYYKDVDTSCLDINLPQYIFNSWIIKHYELKNVKYLITDLGYDKVIFPINKFGEYFSITSGFRTKTSGSSDLPNSHVDIVKKYLAENLLINSTFSIQKEDKHYFLYLSTPITISDPFKFVINSTRYMLRFDSPNKYIIKKLSNTKNPNVIFSIKFNGKCNTHDLIAFKNDLLI
ncbi:PDDEXK family nuclease [Clostridium butyricum]|uniref:hypothetical protein n=1 Tax=Clostridium butyricum TaxID=1492 RepID=UPI00374FCA41